MNCDIIKQLAFEMASETHKKWIGKRVSKKSNKPFKSKNRINKVKEVILHPQTKKAAFLFEEDDSYVECTLCQLV